MSEKLGALQIASLLFVSRVFSILTHSGSEFSGFGDTTIMLGSFIAGICSILLAYLISWVIRRNKANNLLDLAGAASDRFGKFAYVTVGIVCLLVSIVTMVNFQHFLSLAVYPQMGNSLFIICLSAVCVYAAFLGLEAISRFSVIIAVLVVISVIVAASGLSGDIRIINLNSPFEFGVKPILFSAYQGVVGNTELLLFVVLLGRLNRKGNHTFTASMILSMTCYQIVFFLMVATLGDYSSSQSFPIYTLMASANISIFQRLDFIFMVIWIFISFLKISLYLNVSDQCIRRAFPKLKRGIGITASAVVIAGASMVVISQMRFIYALGMLQLSGVMYIVSVLLIPILSVAILKLRKKVV